MPETQETALDRIRRRAYEIYEERGSEPGKDVEDWIAAEREITELAAPKSTWKGTNLAAEQELQPEGQSQKRQSPSDERRISDKQSTDKKSSDRQSKPIRGLSA